MTNHEETRQRLMEKKNSWLLKVLKILVLLK